MTIIHETAIILEALLLTQNSFQLNLIRIRMLFLSLPARLVALNAARMPLTALRWSCCGLSIDEAANLVDEAMPEPTGPADTPGDQVEKREQEHAECVETAAEDCAHGAHHNYSEMALDSE
jgi:hypothetical protein